jgi:hypothetical protein
MFITLKKHKEIIKNLEASLKADLVAKDELIKRLLGEIIEKKEDVEELEQKLEEETLQDLNKLISDYHNYEKSFLPINLKTLAENCIKLINKDF